MTAVEITSKQIEEEKLVREFFKNKKNGFFIEVGANEPLLHSQTFHLEAELNWSGLLIEPIDYLAKKLRAERPKCKVIECACTSAEKAGKAEFFIPIDGNGDISLFASLETDIDHSLIHKTRTLRVETQTLDQIIVNNAPNTKIDLLSIDVEGTELDVLKGSNIDINQPKLIIIEDRMVFLAKHLYLKKRGYKFFRRTGFNNWYSKKVPANSTNIINQMNLFRKLYLSSWIKRIRESFRMKTLKTFTQL